ncbi:carbamoyltransferase HypF [Helicobacter sp. 11S03491-1]|uniref:carbamoyltransferase HypF n=1 Tax=Helicobacter sp. 11S03491-1 TaxID=1476196 RepID=UPI0015DB8A58|nr:carbamoyltransferase HypF [Helicobacter sp. 11S03491-1]
MSANIYRIIIDGTVQGVGFRPFVYTLALEMQAKGWVRNLGGKVEIIIEIADVQTFISRLKAQAPIHSQINSISIKPYKIKKKFLDFQIFDSKNNIIDFKSSIPRDIAICQDCLREMKNPKDRRYGYAFSTCTNCGPRYSIISALPYDRRNTSMSFFQMCSKCQTEYDNPLNRRFHAQPNSCPECKITLKFYDSNNICYEDSVAITKTVHAIKQGKIIAIKGIGGFALVCDGRNDASICALRKNKNRPQKPFAIMVKNTQEALKVADLNTFEIEALNSPAAPIVLVKKNNSCLSSLVSPNINTVGIILPYSGVHHLILQSLDFPLVFTSANLSGEPIIASIEEFKEKMGNIFDGVLDYNRNILQPIDDSIVQFLAGKMRVMRLGRGLAPLNLDFQKSPNPKKSKVCVGMGAQQKINITYSMGNEYLISPFIGDLDNPNSMQRYEKIFEFFSKVYCIKPDILISDLHQNYHSSILSAKKSIQLQCINEKIQHHYAHFCAIFAEVMYKNQSISPKDKMLGIVWDGNGLGNDGKIWGGEIFLGNLQEIQRVGHIKEFSLLGGEGAIKKIYKIGYGLALQSGANDLIHQYENKLSLQESKTLKMMFEKNINAIKTTSVGRLFDGVASLCGLLEENTYEGEAGMILEALSKDHIGKESYPFILTQEGVIDFVPMILEMQADILNGKISKVAKNFIYTLAQITLLFAQKYNPYPVVFSGGVFQNKVLCDRIKELFDFHHYQFYMPQLLPPNDGCISFGQAVYAQYQNKDFNGK